MVKILAALSILNSSGATEKVAALVTALIKAYLKFSAIEVPEFVLYLYKSFTYVMPTIILFFLKWAHFAWGWSFNINWAMH